MPQPPVLNLEQSSRHSQFHPHVLLKCISYQARKNGGAKLNPTNILGQPHFLASDLDSWSADLRRPWVADRKDARPAIPSFFELALKIEAFLRCGLCRGHGATECAHIVPWEECLHHHPHNLIHLCPKCHTAYDVEKRISREELIKTKRTIQTQMLALVLNLEGGVMLPPANFKELCLEISKKLAENSTLFWNFGPNSPLAIENADPDAADPWHRAISKVILPNNRTIANMLSASRQMYKDNAEFSKAAQDFLAHQQSYEMFVEKPNTTHHKFLFPVHFEKLIEKEAAS